MRSTGTLRHAWQLVLVASATVLIWSVGAPTVARAAADPCALPDELAYSSVAGGCFQQSYVVLGGNLDINLSGSQSSHDCGPTTATGTWTLNLTPRSAAAQMAADVSHILVDSPGTDGAPTSTFDFVSRIREPGRATRTASINRPRCTDANGNVIQTACQADPGGSFDDAVAADVPVDTWGPHPQFHGLGEGSDFVLSVDRAFEIQDSACGDVLVPPEPIPDPGAVTHVSGGDLWGDAPFTISSSGGWSDSVKDYSYSYHWSFSLTVQRVQYPIVLVPGLLGSQLTCGGNEIWPPGVFSYLTVWSKLRLTGGSCPQGVGANGKVIEDTGENGYGDELAFLKTIAPGHVSVYGYDWRQSPASLAPGLAKVVQKASADAGGLPVRLVAHSMGGLIARAMLKDWSTAPVASLDTFGTPYRGAPKVALPMLTGSMPELVKESRDFAPGAIGAEELKPAAQSWPGLYDLLPSPNAPAWFGPGRGSAVFASALRGSAGAGQASAALLAAAGARHTSLYDSWPPRPGPGERLGNVNVVVGRGLPTIGSYRKEPTKPNTQPRWLALGTDGDGTVPTTSAALGETGRSHDDHQVLIYHACKVLHGNLMSDSAVTAALRDHLRIGLPIPDFGEDCAPVTAGETIMFINLSASPGKPHATAAGSDAAITVLANGQRLTMAAAEQAGLANFVPTPDGFEALVPAGGGSTVQVSGKSFALRTVAWSSGPIAAYGGLSGTVGVTPSSSGAKVTNAGLRLAPARSDGRGPVTKIKIRRAGKRVLLNATAHDASGSTTTYYRLGTGDARRWRGTLRLTPTAARTLRYFSIDRLGNREVERKLRLR